MNKIQIIKRDSVNWEVLFKDAETCLPYDLTGSIVFFTVKTLANLDSEDTTAIIQKDIDTHSDPTHGITEIALTPTDTNQAAGSYWYDIQLKTAEGNILSTIKGEFEIVQDVTKRTTISA